MAISATVIGAGCLGRAAHRGSLGADVRDAGGGAVEKWVDAPNSGHFKDFSTGTMLMKYIEVLKDGG